MTRDEYEKVIESFWLELQATMASLNNKSLRDSAVLLTELEELKKSIINSKTENADLVSFCYAIVDEYLNSFWEKNISDGFDLYRDKYLNKNKPVK